MSTFDGVTQKLWVSSAALWGLVSSRKGPRVLISERHAERMLQGLMVFELRG